jgi:hypothetical protein
MKIYWLSLFAGLVTLLSFQNCQKSPYQDEINLSKNGNVISTANKINLNEQRMSQVNFFYTEATTVTKNQHTFSMMAQVSQKIDLATGEITVDSDASDYVQTFCLTDDLKNELLSILNSSQICKAGAAPADRVCTAVYKVPYAQIFTTNDKYDLGSATDGCNSNAVDLCDSQSSLLKGFAANLKNKISKLNCNPR